MLVSYNLLTKYVDLPKEITPQEVAEKLTMATVEVEKVIEAGKILDNIVVGKLVKLTKHPNADKLSLADVDIGAKRPSRVVCGGTNLRQGMLVAFAKPGAVIRWHGQGEPVKLEKAKIRGQESQGMICAANEIGLFNMFPHKEFQIMDLTELDLKIGGPLVKVLGLAEAVFDIDNKSLTNRPDLWGHYGIARELSAIFDVKLKDLDLFNEPVVRDSKLQNLKLKIEIKDKDLCPRYLGCMIENVQVAESPAWLKKELISMGHATINNIVDITNYVMEEIGQPLHAFDLLQLQQQPEKKGKTPPQAAIIIRRARKGERLITLDDIDRQLDEEMLVISSGSGGPLAMAGIMGGKDSGIKKDTQSIILEAANFEATTIRRTSQKLQLRTDSSIRFEKILDAELAEIGMRRALKLIKDIIPQAKISQLIVQAGEWRRQPTIIELSHKFLEKRIGTKFNQQEVLAVLRRLGFQVEVSKAVYKVKVPSWRATGDVSIPEDIAEEIVRIFGYDNLANRQELVEMEVAKYQKEVELELKVKNYLSLTAGMHEVFNYPWLEEDLAKKLGFDKNLVEIANPPTQTMKYLQPSLIANLTTNIENNLRYFDEFKIFELARVYIDELHKWHKKCQDKLPEQAKSLAGAVVMAKNKQPFFEIKGIMQGLLEQLAIDSYEFVADELKLEFIDKKKSLVISVANNKIGWLAEIDYSKLNFKNRKVAFFELNWENLVDKYSGKGKLKYQTLPQFPKIERDLAIEVDWEVKWGDVKDVVKKMDELVYAVKFLSEYSLPTKKSLAFRVVYQAERTLRDQEVEEIEQRIVDKLKKTFKAELRK